MASDSRAFADKVFDAVDTDGDGVVTHDELLDHFLATGVEPELIAEIFQYLDLNGDGVVDRSEWAIGAQAWRGCLPADMLVDLKDNGYSLAEFCWDADIAWVHSGWLIELYERGGRLPRRQDMPEEALVPYHELHGFLAHKGDWMEGDKLRENASSNDSTQVRCIAVSHGWLSREHPDPDGVHLEELVKYGGRNERNTFGGKPLKSGYAVFFDFVSMHQQPRTPEEDERFKFGLASMHYIYGHKQVRVATLRSVHDGASNPVEYTRRGWCFFEQHVARLGFNADTYMAERNGGSASDTFQNPPLTIDAFNKQLAECAFSSAYDNGVVVDMYAAMFELAKSELTHLTLPYMKSDGNQAEMLAISMPELGNLQDVGIACVTFDDAQWEVLADAIVDARRRGQLSKLERIRGGNHKIGDRGMRAMARIAREGVLVDCTSAVPGPSLALYNELLKEGVGGMWGTASKLWLADKAPES
mmetsp:Transcript_12550/g.43571  ORF Transcript_12550/g.43571 Transcript_12550/m.43571 type:complete len:473 (-) Transcript_12550:238-1656(-)